MSALPASHGDVYDVLIIGAGLAGLSTALSLPPTLRVAVLSKQDLVTCASEQAQGGIAAALASGDSVTQHAHDTEVAGAGLCDTQAVRDLLTQAPAAVAWLQQHGVAFTTEAGMLHLTREGGHGQRRIVHAADATGAAICAALRQTLAARPQIEVLTHHAALDLLTGPADTNARHCSGARVLDGRTGTIRQLRASHTVLATGGLGQLYACTTNPASATGDGIALAWRAGCRIANLEFIQFHPTALRLPDAPAFLITEAVRGEGGVLRRPDGVRFMPTHDARAELAPRDIVARAIALEMAEHGLPFVLLDISHQPADFIEQHFPTIRARCAQWGIDILREPIPVAPAAHYACGGVVVDTAGRTDLPGLFAVGETACTGLHGANRLASNSLLECVVMGRAAAQAISTSTSTWAHRATRQPDVPTPSGQPNCDQPDRAALARLMERYVGIVRSDLGLRHALGQIDTWRRALPAGEPASVPSLEWRNLLDTAALVVRTARSRGRKAGAPTPMTTIRQRTPQPRPPCWPVPLDCVHPCVHGPKNKGHAIWRALRGIDSREDQAASAPASTRARRAL